MPAGQSNAPQQCPREMVKTVANLLEILEKSFTGFTASKLARQNPPPGKKIP